MFSDDFISYDNEVNVKLEKSSDHEISLDSPSVKTCESTPNMLPMNFSPNLQSLLTKSFSYGGLVQKKKQPFTIIKSKKIDFEDHVEVKIESEEKILSKSKLIMKREKAKQRAMTRQVKPIMLKIEADVASEAAVETPVGEFKNKKKILQMIRNRISAQTSRDRKKAYLHQLEDAKSKLNTENTILKQQNNSLLQEITKLKEANQRMLQQNEALRNKSGLDLSFEQTEDNSKLNQETIERIVRNIINNNSGIFVQDKGSLSDVCSFANTLSHMVFNQVENQSKLETSNKKGEMQLEDDESNKLDVKSVFDKINNDESLFNYTNNLIDDKQNTIFQHLNGMQKANKATFFKPMKDNFNDQSIFSLTNFNLTEKPTDYSLKQEDLSYSFGLKHSNLL